MTATEAVMTTARAGKRVLLVTKNDFSDPKDGGTLRVSAVVGALEAGGYAVDSVPVRSSPGRGFRSGGSAATWLATLRVAVAVVRVGSISVARWYSPAAIREITTLLRRHTFDVVLLEYSQLLVYRPLFGTTPVVLDMHNVEHELLGNYAASAGSLWRRFAARYETARVRALESRAREAVNAVVTVSDRDADMMRRSRGEAAVTVAPNGVSDATFDIVRNIDPDPTVVFIGHLGWQPNIDAAQWLVQRVWPTVKAACPNAKLALIGRTPAASLAAYDGLDGITVHPDVPCTHEYLSAATVATAPLLASGGTRLKILEAMAAGVPVVSTTSGALGLEHLATGGTMEIADDPTEFASAIVQFIFSESDPRTIRRQVERYRWKRALLSLVEVIDTVCRPPSTPRENLSKSQTQRTKMR